MSWGPQRNSIKGIWLSIIWDIEAANREMRPYNGKWQPGIKTKAMLRQTIKTLRFDLDRLEAKLGEMK